MYVFHCFYKGKLEIRKKDEMNPMTEVLTAFLYINSRSVKLVSKFLEKKKKHFQ